MVATSVQGSTNAATPNQLDQVAAEYDTSTDFDGVLTRFAGRLIAPRLAGRRVLECGAASGAMTGQMVETAKSLEVLEAADHYADQLADKFGDKIRLHRGMVEAFEPDAPYDTVVVAGLLHHLGDPKSVLRRARDWLAPGGEIIVTVPNMQSFHRRLHVEMGATDTPYEESERNRRFHQPGRFDPDTLNDLLQSAGWEVTQRSGFFFKPFPHDMMQSLGLSDEVLQGLFEMGRTHPDLACQIFATAVPARHTLISVAEASPLTSAGDLFTSPDWLSVIGDTYGFPLYVVQDEQGAAALPFAEISDLAGRRIVSVPFSDYVAPPADASMARQMLDVAAARFPGHAQSITTLYSDIKAWIAAGWTVEREMVLHQLPVTTEDEMWNNLSTGFRNQVRQGQDQGVTVERSTSLEAIDRFYDLHAVVRNEKFGQLPQPRDFFAHIHQTYLTSGNGFVLEASAKGELAAGCVALINKGTLYYKFSASTAAGRDLRANNVMLWDLVRAAIERGCGQLDLGRSGLGDSYAGLRHFKEGLGADKQPIFTYSRPAPNGSGADQPKSAEFKALIGGLAQILAEVGPTSALNDRASSLIYRYFS